MVPLSIDLVQLRVFEVELKKSEERKEWINGIEEIEQEHIIGRNISFVFKV